jgi:uncharacterized protein HemY
MNRLTSSSVVLLAALPALPAAAQTADHSVQRGAEDLHTALGALIAQHQYARAEQIMRQRLADGDDPAATYFQIGKVYFDHEEWRRSAGFLEESLKLKGINDEAHQILGRFAVSL